VRTPALFHSWWLDEFITRDAATLPLIKPGFLLPQNRLAHSILGFALHDKGPGPLAYVLDGMFAKRSMPLGREFWLRIPGLASAVATTLLLACALPRAISTAAFGIIAAALAAALPEWGQWNMGARGYGWLGLVAIAQLATMGRIVNGMGKRSIAWIVFQGLSLAGLLLHPFHVLWTASLVFAAAVVSPAVRPQVGWNALILSAFHAAWIGLWLYCVRSAGKAGSSSPLRLFHGWQMNVASQFGVHWKLALAIVLAGACAIALLRSARVRRGERLLMWHCILMAAASLVLFGVLCATFHPATRYFYGSVVCAILLAALALSKVARCIEGRQQVAPYAIALAILVLGARPAWRSSAIPTQNWGATAQLLAANAKPDDLIFVGPNSEFEVAHLYARAANVLAPMPIIIQDLQGNRYDTQTIAGLRYAMASPKRLWFVSAYMNQHRTPEFWSAVRSEFRPFASIPGKNPISILVRNPAPTATPQ
jgi:hypothetical protein